MFPRKLLFACFTALLPLLFPVICKARGNHHCNPSSCGNIGHISYPFRLKGDPRTCGDQEYELACENNRTILQLYSGKYYVEKINYDKFSMRVVDAGIQRDNCSSLPLHSLTGSNFSKGDPYTLIPADFLTYSSYYYQLLKTYTVVTFISCVAPVNSTRYVDTALCSKNGSSNFSLSLLQTHSYVVYGDFLAADVVDSCTIGMNALVSPHGQEFNTSSFSGIHNALACGFELLWFPIHCKKCKARGGHCFLSQDSSNVITCNSLCFSPKLPFFHFSSQCLSELVKIIANGLPYIVAMIIGANIAVRILCGIPCVSVFFIHKLRRRHLSMYNNIEEFLQSQNNLMPIRYSYSDIKKMTKGFKDKLGEGGYGSVYKGKLRSGSLVAIKILGKRKANGQEFINEVATIGRIHHVNVVRLIGFCAEQSKRALVYDFMPNGSLEKYIFTPEGNDLVSYEKMYEISLGVARGVEYLHRGCDMQILHFDIKPHNILLDENFTPKISDFGLAKLYPTDGSFVSLTAARGTMGYMAPELFYKNIGGISYKADVYSFGMLLMEMASRRKNLNASIEHLSQIYFPSWVYDQFSEGKDIEIGDATEEERKMVKKMILTALWCIQMKPSDRLSMNKVVEMLEGTVKVIHMPPKPFLVPQEMSRIKEST